MVVLAIPFKTERVPNILDIEQGISLNQSTTNQGNRENVNDSGAQLNQISNLQTSEYCDNTSVSSQASHTRTYRDYLIDIYDEENKLRFKTKCIFFAIVIALMFVLLYIGHHHRYSSSYEDG